MSTISRLFNIFLVIFTSKLSCVYHSDRNDECIHLQLAEPTSRIKDLLQNILVIKKIDSSLTL